MSLVPSLQLCCPSGNGRYINLWIEVGRIAENAIARARLLLSVSTSLLLLPGRFCDFISRAEHSTRSCRLHGEQTDTCV